MKMPNISLNVVTKIINLPAGQSSFSIPNVFTGPLPFKLIFGLVPNDAFNGKYTLNPFAFGNNDLTYFVVDRNGDHYPKTPYEPDYRANFSNYHREFYDFFANIGDNIHAIDYDNYKNVSCLYAFNFNPDFENPTEEEYISPIKTGFINVEIKFRQNLTTALKLICYALFDNKIEIDENRNVILDY